MPSFGDQITPKTWPIQVSSSMEETLLKYGLFMYPPLRAKTHPRHGQLQHSHLGMSKGDNWTNMHPISTEEGQIVVWLLWKGGKKIPPYCIEKATG
jgi:hypothetical protein